MKVFVLVAHLSNLDQHCLTDLDTLAATYPIGMREVTDDVLIGFHVHLSHTKSQTSLVPGKSGNEAS